MKKLIILFVFIAFAKIVFAYDIQQIRKDYIAAIKDDDKAEALYKQLNSIKNPSPLILAYLGSAQAVRAKHAWNPVNKLSYLKQGCKILDEAVSLNPDGLEIRFLRFSLCHYLPSFLGYGDHLSEDRKKIVELVQGKKIGAMHLDEKILKNMVDFMIESKRCTPQEETILKNAIS